MTGLRIIEPNGMAYAGIGARDTPIEVQGSMKLIGDMLARKGFQLRSGGAIGADHAFESAAVNAGARAMDSTLKIFLPSDGRIGPQHFAHAALFHPAWDKCDTTTQRNHARNSAIMLDVGLNNPVNFVVCWTKEGAIVGGTGQALRIAAAYNIPVYNLWWPEHMSALMAWIGAL